jgi:hypothetical protein
VSRAGSVKNLRESRLVDAATAINLKVRNR